MPRRQRTLFFERSTPFCPNRRNRPPDWSPIRRCHSLVLYSLSIGGNNRRLNLSKRCPHRPKIARHNLPPIRRGKMLWLGLSAARYSLLDPATTTLGVLRLAP